MNSLLKLGLEIPHVQHLESLQNGLPDGSELTCLVRSLQIPPRSKARQLHELRDHLLLPLIQYPGVKAVIGQVQDGTGGVMNQRWKLRVAVVRIVAAGEVQLQPADVRGVH